MAQQGFFEEHWLDDEGCPEGGVSTGTGFCVSWQRGPLGRGESRRAPNGAFVEDVLQAVIGRIEFYQAGLFACDENADALLHLRRAAIALENRTRDREARQVEGTHEV